MILPSPSATMVSRLTAPTVAPIRKGMADLNPVVWPMPIHGQVCPRRACRS